MSQTNTIYENLVFSDAQATPALGRVAAKVGVVSKAMSGLRLGLSAMAAGLGAFKVGEAINATTALYERIRRLKAVTGVAAGQAHQLADAFELTGTDSAVADNTIVRLARLSQRASGAGKEAHKLKTTLRAVGVDMTHGVSASFLSMSEAVTKGKLGVHEMARTFKIPLSQAGQLMGTLKQGPERLRAIMAETAKGADLVDQAALESYENMKKAKLELADAWEGLVATVYKKMLPAVTKLVNGLKSGMEAAQPVVTFIGETLSKHMDLVVLGAKAYLGYLIAARAVAATTGGSLGGMIKGQMGSALSFGPRAAAAPMFQAGRQLPGAGRAINSLNIASQFAGRGGVAGIGNTIAQLAARLSPTLGKLLASTVSFRVLLSVIGRFMLIGAVIAVAAKIFSMIKNDVGGFRTRIGAVLGEIVDKFRGVGRTIKPVLSLLSYVFGKVLTGVGYVLLGIFEGVLRAVNFVLTILRAIVNVMATLISSPWWSVRHPVKLFTNAWADAAKTSKKMADQAKVGAGKGKGGGTEVPPQVNQDFRGSTFTITNQFAEGFDVGRVSVALTESIAASGQRRVQSGFAPTFAVRGGS